MSEDTHPPTPCCQYICTTAIPYAVFWNPYNKVVQCHNCGHTYVPQVWTPQNISRSYMILCPTCGNKRCPKATNNTLECTGSNEPGQVGSNY